MELQYCFASSSDQIRAQDLLLLKFPELLNWKLDIKLNVIYLQRVHSFLYFQNNWRRFQFCYYRKLRG